MNDNSLRHGFASVVRSDLLSKRNLLAVTVGLISGVNVVVAKIALASLIFSGPLAPYSSQRRSQRMARSAARITRH